MFATQWLEPAGHEGRNGKQDAQNLIGRRLRGEADPHGQAHEDVAENRLEEEHLGRERHLAGGHRDERLAHGAPVHTLQIRHEDDEHSQKRSGEVADPYNAPVAEQAPKVIFFDAFAHTMSTLP